MRATKWDTNGYPGLIGETAIEIVATQTFENDSDDAQVVLFRYTGKPAIYALRWTLGAVIELGTDDPKKAMGSIDVMASMEASDEY